MQLIDTHCHIHDSTYPLDATEVLRRAHATGVGKMICVGTSQQSSQGALTFAAQHDGVFASIGVHPHDAKDGWGEIKILAESEITGLNGPKPTGSISSKQISSRLGNSSAPSLLSAELATAQTSSTSQEVALELPGSLNSVFSKTDPVGLAGEQSKLIAIGEIGLDYFYTHSPRDVQIQALEAQIALALQYKLPIIFHVREAFDDFWPIFDNFHGIRGVLHSFTDTAAHMEQGLARGLLIGVNGISTFTKSEAQQQMFASVPLKRLLLETDAPFLTPAPLRGKVNEPAFVEKIAAYHAYIHGVSVTEIATITTTNADALFALH